MNNICIISIIVSLLLVFGKFYCNEVLLDSSEEFLLDQPILSFVSEYPLKYAHFNLLDKDLSTSIVVNKSLIKYKETKFPYFLLKFKSSFYVDEIVIFNGYQKDKELYTKNSRVKEIKIISATFKYEEISNGGYSKIIKDDKGVSHKVNAKTIINLETNIILSDTMERQILKFNETFGNLWSFDILSTYPGTKYDDTCISEIEFWYKGEKYEIGNLEEAKKEFLQKVREKVRNTITMYATPYEETGSIEMEPLIKVPFEGLKARWKSLGVEVDKIEMKSYVIGEKYGDEAGEYTMCLVNFVGMDGVVDKTVKGFKGKIVAEAKNGYGKRYKFGRDYINVIQIGEWKIDEYGNLWIKIGKGEWKKAKKEGWRILTGDTDLGEIKF